MDKIENSSSDIELVKKLNEDVVKIKSELSKVIVGQTDVIQNLLISLFAKGHCVLVGVPGLAKTLLIKSLSEVMDLSFNRIQFTPDLMPSDITGTEIIEEDSATLKREFKFIKGPIFSNIVLADEINRTPPKTQAALLEAMQEYKITAAGKNYSIEEPFFVLATQNPIEQEGTYPLPEAQLDRFMFNLWLDYPTHQEEVDIIKSTTSSYSPELQKVIGSEAIINYQNLIRRVPVAENVIDFAVSLVEKTRITANSSEYIKEFVSWGAGPRATQYLILGAKSKAVVEGRFTPNINDVKSVAIPVLRHRVIPSFNAEAEGISSIDIINKLLNE